MLKTPDDVPRSGAACFIAYVSPNGLRGRPRTVRWHASYLPGVALWSAGGTGTFLTTLCDEVGNDADVQLSAGRRGPVRRLL
ncbi:hypothetical protein KIF59_01390 [Enterobacter cloacae subsp. cloacae]|nr:hypothetical protein [Enterobacter cloacae subsp. cloacae]